MKREQLEKLQVQVTETYSSAISEMNDTGEYNAAILNGARQLLKDNDIISLTEQGTPLGKLADLLPFEDPDPEAVRQTQ
jgi:hypothetical protein|tara:strand:+ start:12457 stop:12693 length:237 start_codon:yes stop_codon:yes gene_type:complete